MSLSEICSGGLLASNRLAMTKPQLATGPQKWIVLGPTGELIKAMSFSAIAAVFFYNIEL